VSGEAAEDIARRILEQLGQAWNAGNGGAFGQPFAADADFVAIRGEYHHSRDAISRGHQALFDTIYTGSTVTYSLLQARALTESVILVHAQGQLQAPRGPLAGEHTSTISLVLVRPDQDADWRIEGFHNTLVAPP
jgi:uncharacterized protein (TIGR02246 family)